MNFKEKGYEPSTQFEGSHIFNKHYFPPKPGEMKQLTGTGELTEEFQCAFYLDNMGEVAFWVRNLPGKATSFRLQTATDWFYPDFVCQLKDGRILVVEYKGQHFYSADDARQKAALGAVWESRSKGKCLFVMPTAGDLDSIGRKVRGS